MSSALALSLANAPLGLGRRSQRLAGGGGRPRTRGARRGLAQAGRVRVPSGLAPRAARRLDRRRFLPRRRRRARQRRERPGPAGPSPGTRRVGRRTAVGEPDPAPARPDRVVGDRAPRRLEPVPSAPLRRVRHVLRGDAIGPRVGVRTPAGTEPGSPATTPASGRPRNLPAVITCPELRRGDRRPRWTRSSKACPLSDRDLRRPGRGRHVGGVGVVHQPVHEDDPSRRGVGMGAA